jgi:hypothetical protein
LRENGIAVHGNTVVCAVTALMIARERIGILSKIPPTLKWAYKWLKRKKFTDRKATKATSKKPEDPKVNL